MTSKPTEKKASSRKSKPNIKQVDPKSRNTRDLRNDFYRDVDAGILTVREGIKRFRRMLGMSQPEFAKFVGVSSRVFIEFEQGHGNPTLKTVAKMLRGSGLELRLGRKNVPISSI